MNTVTTNPTRLPALTAGRLGRSRHFSPVTPFVRAHLALRRITVEAVFVSGDVSRGGVEQGLIERRRVVHACSLD